jgi:hypothetical protein
MHHAARNAIRTNGMYLTRNLVKNEKGAEIIAAAFTNRLSILLSIVLETRIMKGRCDRKPNTALPQDGEANQRFKQDVITGHKRNVNMPKLCI